MCLPIVLSHHPYWSLNVCDRVGQFCSSWAVQFQSVVGKYVSNLVFYTQSTIMVISGRSVTMVWLLQSMSRLDQLDLTWNNLHNTREELSVLRKHCTALRHLDIRHNPWIKVTCSWCLVHLTHLAPDCPLPPALFPYGKTPDHLVAAG